ncbi:MAG: M16 family metallopeptidase [Spirochaetaceae bacterium]
MNTGMTRALPLIAGILMAPTALFGAGVQEPAETLQAPQTLLPLDEDITYGRLPNGLTYYIRQNEEPQDRASLRLVVDAGSVLERAEQRGLAHFVEHMAFNGTEDYAGNELISFLESLGMRFGPDLNAYTSFDETVYMLEVPTDDREKLRSGFHVLEQWARAITFDPEEIDSERGVIVEEWRSGRGAAARLRDEHFPVIFEDSRYAERLPIGDMDVIRSFERELLLEYYRDWYRPDLMSVVAVGDFDVEEVRRLIHRRFAPLRRPEDAPERPTFSIPGHGDTRVSVATDPEASSTQVNIYRKHDPKPLETVSDYRQSTIENLYSIMLNNRLDEISREPDAPFLQAGAGSVRLVRGAEVSVLTALTESNDAARGLEAVAREARRTEEHGFADSELERAKRELESSYRQAYEERSKTRSPNLAEEYTRHFLTGEAAPGIEFEYELVTALLPEITVEDVSAVAGDFTGESNRVVTVSAPEDEKSAVPSEEELHTVLSGVRRAELEPYETAMSDRRLIEEPPEPGEVVSETELEEIDAVEWELSNGARVVVKPTDFRNDEILFAAFSPGGTSRASDEIYRSASQAAQIVSDSGLGELSATELERVLAGRRVRMSPYINELTEGLEGSASREDVELMFQLAHLYFTSPREDEEAFETYMRRLRSRVENRRADPQTVFSDRLRAILSGDAERRRPLTLERLEEIELEEAYRFYRERFADAGDFTFFVVGSTEPSVLRPLVERYLAGLPGDGEAEGIGDPEIERPDGVVEDVVRKGIEPQSRIALVFHGDYEWSREENHVLRGMAEALERRLREIIREEEGGTYGIRVSATPRRYPDEEYLVYIRFSTDPVRARELTDRVYEVIEGITEEGLDESYAERVRSTLREDFEEDIRTNTYWRDMLEGLYFHELEPARILEYPELVDELTAEALTDAVRRYLDTEQYVELILLPEENEQEESD